MTLFQWCITEPLHDWLQRHKPTNQAPRSRNRPVAAKLALRALSAHGKVRSESHKQGRRNASCST